MRFKEGQDVRAGDVLARIDPRIYQAALDQAVAKKKQDEATLANARLDSARYAKLAATAYTSAQQADTARSQVAQLEAQVQSDQAQIDNARTQFPTPPSPRRSTAGSGFRQVDAGNIVHAADADRARRDHHAAADHGAVHPAAAGAAARSPPPWPAGAPEVLPLPQDTSASAARPVLDAGTLTVLDNQVDPPPAPSGCAPASRTSG